MAYNLPTNFALDDPNHVAAHNNTNAAVNDLDSRVTSATSRANTALQPAYVSAGTGVTKTGAGTAASPLTLSTLNGASLRRDTSVGERIIATVNGLDTMLYGDTGWRNVDSLLVNGWTAHSIRMRRVGNVWFIRFRGLNGSAATDPMIMDLGQWVPESGAADGIGVVIPGTPSDGFVTQYGGQGWLRLRRPSLPWTTATDAPALILSIPTTSAWPTTLPGTHA